MKDGWQFYSSLTLKSAISPLLKWLFLMLCLVAVPYHMHRAQTHQCPALRKMTDSFPMSLKQLVRLLSLSRTFPSLRRHDQLLVQPRYKMI